MKLSIGFSPCPNDTFIFDAWVNQKIEQAITITPFLEDVETLNEWATDAKLDVTKLSFPALFRNLDQYRLLMSGSALGNGVGPLLIARNPIDPNDPEILNKKILLPGRTTTANLLFSYAYPAANNKSYRIFNEIEQALLDQEAELGVIIHENRFTYHQKGLHLVKDLGTHWEQQTNCAVPLGCIAIKRSLGEAAASAVTKGIQNSLQYAWENLPEIAPYVNQHAQEMEESVMKKHIDLYVNDHTLELSAADIHAIETLYRVYCEIEGVNTSDTGSLF